jgi:acylphosphatase
MVRHKLLIKGRVQGVSYRKSTKRMADELRVNGWVRNLPTGEVEACFEGPRSAVIELTSWCKQGPPRSKVEEIVVEQGEFLAEFARFEITE